MIVSGPSKVTTQQPRSSIEMVTTAAPVANNQEPTETKPMRLRGGGAGKQCCLGLLACCICFECCKDCCECWVGIICCPCETLCCC